VETPTVRPHVATWPSDGPHVEPRTTSEILLLMDLMSSVKAGTRQVLYEPLAPPSLCARCEAAYAAARRTVELAGGIEAWSRQLGRTLKVDKLEPAKKESRAREQDAAALAKRFGEPMSRVLGWIGMDWRMDGGTWEQARDRVARRLGRQAAGARRRAGP
jgi:AcrR family transcriptional regulator